MLVKGAGSTHNIWSLAPDQCLDKCGHGIVRTDLLDQVDPRIAVEDHGVLIWGTE